MENRQNKINASEVLKLLPFFTFFVVLTFLVSGNVFFWDTIQLGSKHAHFFYDNNFSKIFLPDEIDSGHIPAFGFYLALCWKIFGKSLFVSHFAMLPFLIGIVWQAYLLLKKYIEKKYIYLALTLFLADATLLAQATLISPDIPLIFLFLMALNSVLKYNKLMLSIAVLGLFLVSMRGMMVSFAILLIDITQNLKFSKVKDTILYLLKKSVIYLPAFLVFVGFELFHYKIKGWIGYHENSQWAECFKQVDFHGFLHNFAVLIWRLVDFGRIFLWIATNFLIIKYFKNCKKDKKFLQIIIFFIIILICLSATFVLYKNLSGHRYILPVYLVFSLLTIYLIFEKIKNKKTKYIVFTVLLVGLLSGNFWIYPDKISQGWDSSMAYLPYFNLRNKMMNYMKTQNIKIEDVACVFPNECEQKFLDLSNINQRHQALNLDSNEYVLYSNIYNDFTDEEVKKMKTDFILVRECKHLNIFICLYKKK